MEFAGWAEQKNESRLGELEAALFASRRPLSAATLARRLELPEAEIAGLLARYAAALAEPGRGLKLREAQGGWQLRTKPAHEDVVRRARAERGELPLTAAALETLAAVALRQPVSTQEVNRERGRDSGGTLRTLRKRGLVMRGPALLGSPGLWRTTGRFLDACGAQSLDELHRVGAFARSFARLREAAKEPPAPHGELP